MVMRTIIPKIGDKMHYIGKPVKDKNANRIGSIVDVLETDNHYELIMEVEGVYSESDIKSCSFSTGKH